MSTGRVQTHKSSVVAKFINQALAGETLEIFGDGSQTRDFIYIGDLLRAVRRAVDVPDLAGEVFQIATSAETSVAVLAELLLASLERHDVTAAAPAHAEARLGDVMRNFSDTRKAQRMLGWRAETGLGEGLDRTVAWFLSRGTR